jgi:hypothetical protein
MFETLFSLAGTVAMAGWIALAVIPRHRPVARPIAIGVAVALSGLYVALIASFWTSGTGDFGSLAGVSRLFTHPGLLLAGWVHYLAFDLLVGLWERDEARRIGLPWWQLVPCLLVTFLFGPMGWLAFLACRHVHLRTRTDIHAVAGPTP